MKVLFLDTNILIQCKDLKELPWHQIQSDDSLLLIISRPVQEELDRLKGDGNSRRAKRARKATRFLREIILSEDSKSTIKKSNPKVQISISPKLSRKNNFTDILDIYYTDDRILAEMIAYKDVNPDHGVAILTQDISLLTTAKNLNLQFVTIPDDWLLPPESDPRDKRIIALEDRLKILEKTQPDLQILALDDERNTINSKSIEVSLYEDFEIGQLNELVSLAKTKHPIATNFDNDVNKSKVRTISILSKTLGVTKRYEPPKKEEIEKYQNEQYPQWLKVVEEFFNSLPYHLEFPSRSANITISVNNIGGVPIEDLVIEFSIYGGLLFNPQPIKIPHRTKKWLRELPKPPNPPEGYIIEEDNSPFAALYRSIQEPTQRMLSDTSFMKPDYSFNTLLPPEPRDKNCFYRKDGMPTDYTDKLAFECEEFLHHVDPKNFHISVFAPTDTQDGDEFTLRCRAAARNLHKPIIFNLPITIICNYKDTFEIAKSLIK